MKRYLRARDISGESLLQGRKRKATEEKLFRPLSKLSTENITCPNYIASSRLSNPWAAEDHSEQEFIL